MTQYKISGRQVIAQGVDSTGCVFEEAAMFECDQPEKALEMWKRARYLNDVKSRYTDSARKIAAMDHLPGFRWLNEGEEGRTT